MSGLGDVIITSTNILPEVGDVRINLEKVVTDLKKCLYKPSRATMELGGDLRWGLSISPQYNP